MYLGYRIDKNGIHALTEKVEAVKNAPEPKNVTELKFIFGSTDILLSISSTHGNSAGTVIHVVTVKGLVEMDA